MLPEETAIHSDYVLDRHSLLATALERFVLDPRGIHGVSHWARVRYHGLRIGRERGADLLLVELFAFLHDSCRDDDYLDPHHGFRAAEFAMTLNGSLFSINDAQLHQLTTALEGHSKGAIHADVTIQSCWDADRLDLVRLNIPPHAKYLSNEATLHIDRAWALLKGRKQTPTMME